MAALAFGIDRALAGRRVSAAISAVVALVCWAWLPDRDVAWRSSLELLAVSIGERAPIRSLLSWLVLALAGLVIGSRRDPRVGAGLAVVSLVAVAPGLSSRGGAWEPITTIALAAPAAITADAIARALARVRLDARQSAIVFASALALLLAIGGVRRALAAGAPFRIATERSVRGAHVFHGDVPCDFLAWEHMSWECSHYDQGLYGMAGLALSEGIRVGGEERELMIVPTGRSGQERRVVWPDVRAGRALELRWAVPDGQRGDVVVEVRVDDAVIDTIEIPAQDDGVVHAHRVETPAAGERARLELRVRPRARRAGAVALDGIWR